MPFSRLIDVVLVKGYVQGFEPGKDWPQQLAVGDFNGDGRADFLLTRADYIGVAPTTASFFLGNANGIWSDGNAALFGSSLPLYIYSPRVAVADFNNDGRSDVYLPDFGLDGYPFPGGQDHLWLSSGAGVMTDSSSGLPQLMTLAHGVSVGDIDQDGDQDLVVNNLGSGLAYPNSDFVLINQGNGVFSEMSSSLLPVSLRVGAPDRASHTWSGLVDVNGDSFPDLILGTWDGAGSVDGNSPPSQVLLNDGSGSFADSIPIDLPHSPIAKEIVVAIQGIDLNSDGNQDLVVSVTNGGDFNEFYSRGYIQLLVNDGTGHFVDETAGRYFQDPTLPGGWWKFVQVVDLNGDDANDLVIAAEGQTSTSAKVLLNDGTGHFHEAYSLPASASGTAAIAVANVGGDSRPDLVFFNWASPTTAKISALINDLAPIAGFNEIDGSGLADNLHGGDSADRMSGMEGGDQLIAGGGGDSLRGGQGDDLLNGGEGLDRALFSGEYADYIVFATLSGYVVEDTSGSDGVDNLTGIEFLQFSDRMVFLGSEETTLLEPTKVGGNAYVGSDGDDLVEAGSIGAKISAGNGNNIVITTGGKNSIASGFGNDLIITGAGDDKVRAGEGRNAIDAGEGNNNISTLNGDDAIFSGSGSDKISAGDGNNHVHAGDGNNKITAGTGDDVIISGDGDDKVTAGVGNKTVSAGSGANKITTQGGDDAITTGTGKDKIVAGDGNNLIVSGGGDDNIKTGDGNDIIDAGSGNDKVLAGGGGDRISGGAGFDKLTGGAGADTFVFGNYVPGEFDVIADFSDEDTLEFSSFVFNALAGASAENFVIGLAAIDGNDFLVYDTNKGVLYYDADGAGGVGAVQIALLKGSDAATVTFSDFVIA